MAPSKQRALWFAATGAAALLLLCGCGGAGSGAQRSATAVASGSASLASKLPAPVDAPLPPEVQQQLQAMLDGSRSELQYPGAIAGVWSPAGTWIGTVGNSGKDSKRAPQRDDHTRIGSLTKTFTVMALLQLADQGRVSLDDPIGKYVPGVPNADTATLRTLANMTSGIPSYTADPKFGEEWSASPDRTFTPQQLVDYVKTTPASFPAGTQVQYSNTNTVLLGMVIEQITGKPVAEVFRTNLLQPLGMTQTSFPGLSADLPKPHLDGITEQGKPEGQAKDATYWNPSWGFTAGEMISTLDDLRVWTVALGTGAGLVSEAMQAEREKSTLSTVPPNNVEQTYALGFFTRYGWWGHNGSLPGYTTFAAYQPNSKTSIVVMVNSDITSEQQPTAPADLVARAMMSELADAGLVPPPPSASESAGASPTSPG